MRSSPASPPTTSVTAISRASASGSCPRGAKRYFIHTQYDGRRVWRLVGQAADFGVDEASERARALLAEIRNGNDDATAAPPDAAFEAVAEGVFQRYVVVPPDVV